MKKYTPYVIILLLLAFFVPPVLPILGKVLMVVGLSFVAGYFVCFGLVRGAATLGGDGDLFDTTWLQWFVISCFTLLIVGITWVQTGYGTWQQIGDTVYNWFQIVNQKP